ncbi:MAG: degV family protein [Bacillales bacterium]|nr:degV family protein [Bacillales bacterium]
MSNYILSCCSTADLSLEHLNKREIHYIGNHYSLDAKEYKDDLGQTVSNSDFYKAMVEGAETKTSQVSTGEFVEYFGNFLENGRDILHVSLSSGLSGSYNSANIAKSILLEQYPDRSIYIVDSLGASSGYGLLVDKLAELRDSGMSATDLNDWANEHKLEIQHWFFSTDLTFYIKGGRISKSAGMVGSVLKVCPLLNMNDQGKLIPKFKIRGKKKVIEAIVAQMEKYVSKGHDYKEKCYISHSDCIDDAIAVANLVESRFPNLIGQVEINNIGTTVGSHTGPGTVALFFWGDIRID